MPDFDIDFDERRRGEVIRYVTEKYGDDRVAMIVTYGTIKAKQAVKDSSRILGYPFAMGDRITKAMPAAVMGKDVPLAGDLRPRPQAVRRGGRVPRPLRRRQRRQEGRRHRHRHRGPQAPVGRARRRRDHVQRAADRRHPDHEAPGRTARSSRSSTTRPARRLGLIKMDFLGLRNLTVLDDALSNIEANRARRWCSRTSSSTTPRPTSCSARGDTLGVFQLDGGPMRSAAAADATRQLRGHLRGAGALPPRPDGSRQPHQLRAAQERQAGDQADPPRARPSRSPTSCEPTYGLIVYQEQIMAIAQKLAGYTLGQADLLRQAMGKKKKEILDAEYVPLLRGHAGTRLLRAGHQGAVGHPGAVLRLRLQQGAHRGVRPGLLLDRLSQGALPGRVHGRAADVGEGRQGQDGDLPQRVPPDEDPGAPARRQRVRSRPSPRSATTSASA